MRPITQPITKLKKTRFFCSKLTHLCSIWCHCARISYRSYDAGKWKSVTHAPKETGSGQTPGAFGQQLCGNCMTANSENTYQHAVDTVTLWLVWTAVTTSSTQHCGFGRKYSTNQLHSMPCHSLWWIDTSKWHNGPSKDGSKFSGRCNKAKFA